MFLLQNLFLKFKEVTFSNVLFIVEFSLWISVIDTLYPKKSEWVEGRIIYFPVVLYMIGVQFI